MKRVLIVGGGTGATMLANTLDKRQFDVTVLSKSPEHVFQPALLYVAFKNAKPRIARDERRLLPRGLPWRTACRTTRSSSTWPGPVICEISEVLEVLASVRAVP